MSQEIIKSDSSQGKKHKALPHFSYRSDIDGLRAIAVLSVIIFHAFPSVLGGGFVGVDVFFVISGFLITSIILKELEANTFSFLSFYGRRITRIFPALIIVLTLSLVFGWFTLLTDEFELLGKHVAGGAAFSANLLFWTESGYFDKSAESKPLLHLWSLGIEEQFYIIWPIILLLAYKRNLNILSIIVTLWITSFTMNINVVRTDLTAAFYSPQTRFWELLVGAFLAYLAFQPKVGDHLDRVFASLVFTKPQPRHIQRLSNIKAFGGLTLIVIAVVFTQSSFSFPGWWALAPTMGAALMIGAGQHAWPNRKLLSAPLIRGIGLMSFPLYLWHWPLLIFPRIIEGGEPRIRVRLLAIAAAFLLAYLTYALIEKPIRFGALKSRRTAPALFFAMALLAGFGMFVFSGKGVPARAVIAKSAEVNRLLEGSSWTYNTNALCKDNYPEHFRYFCVQSKAESPTVLLLGDSFANHLYGGLANSPQLSRQSVLNYGSCPPTGVDGDVNVMANCQTQNEIIATTPSLKFAIISAFWPRFTGGGQLADLMTGDVVPDSKGYATSYANKLDARIALLEAHGIQVIVFGPKPELGYDPRDCFSRPLRVGIKPCTMSRAEVERQQKEMRNILEDVLGRHPKAKLFDQNKIFCDEILCDTKSNDLPMLRDPRHYSQFGSKLMSEQFVEWAKTEAPQLLD